MYKKNITKGAQFLDSYFKKHKKQHWSKRIDSNSLNMVSNTYCILGQLFKRGYGAAIERLNISLEEARNLGFICTSSKESCTCDILTKEWKNFLKNRRGVSLSLI